MSLFDSLGVGYSGLNTSQVGINVTGQNVSNSETDGYSRKRVIQSAATPIKSGAGNIGNGVEVENIERVFDNFVFRRYSETYADKEESDFTKQTLDELSTYFPEVDNVGIKADLKEYYDLWQRFGDNPNDNSVKIALAQQTQTLTDHIQALNSQVYDMQQRLNSELKVNIDEVNRLASQIADINKKIDSSEAGGGYTANDLRDKRSVLERDLSRLIGAEVSVESLSSDIQVDPSTNKATGGYNLHINGFNIVDGATFHPLKLDNSKSQDGFYEIGYERQDGKLVTFDRQIQGGKVGAILSLRGREIDDQSGMPTDGTIQQTYSKINAFARGLITSTNNIYAKSSTTSMTSNAIEYNPQEPLINSDSNINTGSFDVIVYDEDGNEVARREININEATTLTTRSNADGNSIEEQFGANLDDNDDGNATNDIDDMIDFFAPDDNSGNKLQLHLKAEYKDKGYSFAIEDNLKDDSFSSGTNFAGALGLRRFFDGEDAKDISLNFELKDDPTAISAGASDSEGDNSVALSMVQHQFEKYNFRVNQESYEDSVYGFFDTIATNVGTMANKASTYNDSITAQFNAIKQEYDSVSKVNIDEEMTNLIRYQTAYSASAKVITTVDQMLNTLLGIKQ
ncbi:Flagellar hook-associated protein FlgK [hydrothermal vent metagenome]|uniref:Flagellar hook-associated protein FlgK n=1 Tax=hydrothermal vent metagenome TaxID=652676 RepID=A0A1W1BDD0_9ZZZZ